MDKIAQIINNWDPANLMSHAPDDEYDYEIEKIKEIMDAEYDPIRLAHAIKKILTVTFGGDVNCQMETYIRISKELLASK